MLDPYISVWFISYFIPALLGCGIIYFYPKSQSMFRLLVIHCALCVSILLSQYFMYLKGDKFPWEVNILSVVFLMSVMVLSPLLVGRFGIFYVISAFIQELTMLSIGYCLLNNLNFFIVVILIVPIYAVAHLLNLKYWRTKLFLTFVWGAVSLALFIWQTDIILNTAIHAIFGILLIHQGVLYTLTDFSVGRSENSNVQSWMGKYLR